ncbi:MAG: TonB-dependent receptor, partial [Gammaproteobacteria bacterium]|nr:TonB-dependent receptor [Gammaproteobacteria bacterium]
PYLVANNPALLANSATASQYGKPITSIPNVYGALGSPTAYSPPFNINARLRYEWTTGNYDLFVQAGGMHQGHRVTTTGYVPSYDLPSYSSYDAAAGISRESWSVELYGQNITNVNTPLEANSAQFVLIEVPPRPRVIGVRFDYKFSPGR